ncbi:hypothetical protein OAF98_05230 [Planctomicrobium sp.]|jgi:hypothetical protein|nr:hypothetical protein [Planctomicrobium sp.]MBT5017233.1 hypothetical protein [Planctomicrobium sp.]MDB4743870.1 hypothetical protein [Planctomicrobium sp.]MDB4802405.1 hypothetical protein [bacterium]
MESYELNSKFQSARTKLHVIEPEFVQSDSRYEVLFLLPVEAGDGSQWRSPVAEAVQHDLTGKAVGCRRLSKQSLTTYNIRRSENLP